MAKMEKLALVLLLLLGTSALFVKCDDLDEDETPKVPEEESDEGTDKDGVLEEEDVLVLTSANFDKVINSEDIILVEFYAPWCGHCKSLAPKYASAAKTLKDHDPPIPLAKVDATENEDLGTRFEVSGYPTLKFFKDGQAFDYEGGRTEFDIVNYMKERADPLWRPPPDAVMTLTSDNFTEVVNREELILVEFYAPWCGHCKRLAPEYEKAAKTLKQRQPPIPLAKVDATVSAELAKEYGVSGYPTLKMFRKGRVSEYKGEREERGIVGYMIQHQGEAAKELESDKAVRNYMSDDDISIIAFFSSKDDPRLQMYMDAANDMRDDFNFAFTLSSEARNRYKVNPGSVVVFNAERYYTKFEPKWHILNKEELTSEDVSEFVKAHQVPLVGTYDRSTERRYDTLKPLCFVFYTVDWSFDGREATQIWRRKMADIAKDYKNEIYFVIANEESNDALIKDFQFEESGEEMNIGIVDGKQKKYPMETFEDFDADDIREFLNNYKKGKVNPIVKSQPIPKKQGPVITVVGKTFDKIVRDNNKDVLIEFYAPWCGHCKSLEPKYKELAKKYKSTKKLVIAKMDATANDVPEDFKVEGFPTLFFVRSGDSKPVKYEEGREVEDFSKYLEENASSLGKKAKEEL
ncbi:protein disulfide-isomerase A4-like [Haliotis rufescens]|uniref:protein disulfide-isomerase A4-like n=1 Tax=Haliotis rufescens TaxID=6454 RepID=UPI00201E7830|nr:protein disulfide-isomerase A4-like [Haliotis rufescens]